MKNQLETLILMIQAQERWLLLCLIGRGLRCSAPTGHRGVSAQGHRGVTAQGPRTQDCFALASCCELVV